MVVLGGCSAVQVLLLGGVPDPVVRLNATSSGRVCSLISTVACANETVIGFAGWRLLPDGPVVRGNALVDREIMGSPSFLALSPNVRAHVASEANRLASCAASPLPLPAERVADDKCRDDAPIYGPDDPKEVTYSPGTDDEGCFQTMQSDNNCYNVGRWRSKDLRAAHLQHSHTAHASVVHSTGPTSSPTRLRSRGAALACVATTTGHVCPTHAPTCAAQQSQMVSCGRGRRCRLRCLLSVTTCRCTFGPRAISTGCAKMRT
jgi:hypothetical protein